MPASTKQVVPWRIMARAAHCAEIASSAGVWARKIGITQRDMRSAGDFARRAAGETAGQRIAGDVDVAIDEAGGGHEAAGVEVSLGARRSAVSASRLAHRHDAVAAHRQGAVLDDPALGVHASRPWRPRSRRSASYGAVGQVRRPGQPKR